MFSPYEPLTVETANEHLSRTRKLQTEALRNESRRAYVFRIPIFILANDGLVLLRDMTTVASPTPNACVAPPVYRPKEILRSDSFGKLVSRYVRVKIFPFHKFERIPGVIQQLGVYRNYSADASGAVTDITSVPARVNLTLSSDDLLVTGDFRHFRGDVSWREPSEAEAVLTAQFDSLPDNNLAMESMILMSVLNRQLQEPVDAAH